MITKKLRPLLAGFCATVLLAGLSIPALAANERRDIEVTYDKFKVTLDGKSLGLLDAAGKKVEPFSYDGTIYLPMRAVATALGLRVDWLPGNHTIALTTTGETPAPTKKSTGGTKKTVTLTAAFSDLKLTLDNAPFIPKDERDNPTEPFAINGTTYLPVRAVADAMGLKVDFIPASNTVALTSRYPALDPKTATAYLKGVLDNLYTGKYTEAFLDTAGMTEGWARQDHQDKLAREAAYFGRYYGIVSLAQELDDEDTLAALALVEKLFEDIYAKAKYSVGTGTASKDGTFKLEVTVSPIDLMTKLTADEVKAAWTAALAKVTLTEEQAALLTTETRAKLDRAYAEALEQTLRGKLSGLGYHSNESVTVKIQRNEDGAYFLSDDDFDQIDSRVIHYPRK